MKNDGEEIHRKEFNLFSARLKKREKKLINVLHDKKQPRLSFREVKSLKVISRKIIE